MKKTEYQPVTVHFHLSAQLAQVVGELRTERSSWGTTTRALLEFGIAVLEHGRREISGLLTVKEWRLMADAFNSTLITPDALPFLHCEIADADEDGALSEKWGVAGESIAARLRAASPAAQWAVADALMRLKLDIRASALARLGIAVSEGV
jgi:hypothetical protein